MAKPDDELYEDDDLVEGEGAEDNEPIDERAAAVGSWTVSIIVHVLVLLILYTIVVLANPKKDQAPVRITVIEPPTEKPEPPPERDIVEEVVTTIDAEVESPNPIVTNLELPVEEISTEDPEVTESQDPKGREEAVSTSEMGGQGAFAAIGAGGGGAGMFGSRSGGGRRRAVGANGGSRGSESAVEAALRWFARHQSPNGQWDVDGYPANCDDNPKCEPGQGHTAKDGDHACTGYALLAFLGAGYDHKTPNKWRKVVQAGLEWLVAQGPNFGRNYEQGVAAMALAEAYAMTNDPWLREPAQLAINLIKERQLQDGGYGLGWDYVAPKASRVDSSVSGWCAMALKSAAAGGLDVGNSMTGVQNYLERAWLATAKKNGQNPASLDPYRDQTKFPYTWDSTNDEVGRDNLACVGLVLGVFSGLGAGDIKLETMANFVMANQVPTGYPTNTYFMYYNTLGIFQMGGERWQKWNAVCRDILVNSQRKGDGCFDGSWDWEGTQFHGHNTGRLLSTAYNVLSLEVYYRYVPQAGAKKK